MLENIESMYITLIPLILTGIFNMVFCTTRLANKINKPIDCGKCLKDGKRIFGDNKTFKGVVGYIVIGMITTIFWGLICSKNENLETMNYIYVYYENNVTYNLIIGAALGFAYALFELPNSFLKRRCGIVPGKTAIGPMKYVFVLLDQCDSIIGCVLVIVAVYPMSIGMYLLYILLGICTHLFVNVILYVLKLRKNIL